MAAPSVVVERFLNDLPNHVRLAPHSVQMLSLDRRPDGDTHALVRLRGPLGVRRTASTELSPSTEASSIKGRARIGDRSMASVAWTVRDRGDESDVTLCATVDAASKLDALLLRFGGRYWLSKAFAAALGRLSAEVAPVAVNSPVPARSGQWTATPVPAFAEATRVDQQTIGGPITANREERA